MFPVGWLTSHRQIDGLTAEDRHAPGRNHIGRTLASGCFSPADRSLRLLYEARGPAISLLYETAADNGCMKTITHRSHLPGWRSAGMILSALLFVLSIAELIFRPGTDAAL